MISVMNIQGIKLHNIDYDVFMANFRRFLQRDGKRTIAFVNAHCVNVARKDKEYRDIIGGFDLCLPDGVGMLMASLIKGCRIKENLNGTDLIPRLFRETPSLNMTLFFIGGRPGIADRAKENLRKEYPNIKIVGCEQGYFDKRQGNMIVNKINESKANVVLVGMGVPKQEKWIAYNKDKIDAKIFIGVGGFFDFAAGAVRRAPGWMIKAKVEWMYRLLQEPKRLWKRYILGNPEFLYNTLKELLKSRY